jgi:hypothetical protein
MRTSYVADSSLMSLLRVTLTSLTAVPQAVLSIVIETVTVSLGRKAALSTEQVMSERYRFTRLLPRTIDSTSCASVGW